VHKNKITSKTVLVTGGTSGLGLELVKVYLKKGFFVAATGRRTEKTGRLGERFRLFITDFSNLKKTTDTVKELCENYRFDIIINNAGILSPPDLILTTDGFEYTFQVNFLAHLLLNEMIIRNDSVNSHTISAVITSPAYRVAESALSLTSSIKNYRPFRAYADSKLFLALMCRQLAVSYAGSGMKFIGLDPGIFSSEIFRMQREWFRVMYRIAAPFMRSAEKVAKEIAMVIERKDLENGSVYDFRGRVRQVPVVESDIYTDFWGRCYESIGQFFE